MSHFKYLTTLIFVFGFIGCESVNQKSCHENKLSYEWQPKDKPAPGTLNFIGIHSDFNETIAVLSKGRRKNFNLTVLLKPFVANQTQCPPDPNTETDLRKFHESYSFKMDDNSTTTRIFENACTGCYYFIMTNDENQHWLIGPKHFKTNYTFRDTMLQCNATHIGQTVGRNCDNTLLDISFRIPSECLVLEVKLFALKDQNPDTLKKCKSGEIPAENSCSISLINCNATKENVIMTCEKSSNVTALEISPTFEPATCGTDESWNTRVFWTGLSKSPGAYYYSTFEETYNCEGARKSDFTLWVPATDIDFIDHHWRNDTECKDEIPQKKIDINPNIIYIVMAIILILISVYWIGKLIRYYLSLDEHSRNETHVMISIPQEEWLDDIKKSTDILLVYARDSDEFTKAVDHLRVNLKQKCSYQIRDIYSDNELQNVSSLTVPVWIEKIMKSGCKIIWIDTPKFRSRLNDDKLNEKNGEFDFRETSVRYAVNLAKTTFENTTQYCRHFVLEIEGFDEFNGVEDPLLTITHYVRYHYPEHVDDLCEQLNK